MHYNQQLCTWLPKPLIRIETPSDAATTPRPGSPIPLIVSFPEGKPEPEPEEKPEVKPERESEMEEKQEEESPLHNRTSLPSPEPEGEAPASIPLAHNSTCVAPWAEVEAPPQPPPLQVHLEEESGPISKRLQVQDETEEDGFEMVDAPNIVQS